MSPGKLKLPQKLSCTVPTDEERKVREKTSIIFALHSALAIIISLGMAIK